MRPIVFLLGPTDEEYGGFHDVKRGQETSELTIGGCLPLERLYQTDEEIRENSLVLVGGFHDKIRLPRSGVNLFNLVADPVASRKSLKAAERLSRLKSFRRVLNSPAKVRATGRANAQRLFKGIGGLRVPRTLELTSTAMERIREQVNRAGLAYPMIARAAGLHGGQSMQRVADEVELAGFVASMGDDLKLLLIEYLDARQPNGLYQKARLAFIDGEYYPRHLLVSEHWNVHVHTRRHFMNSRPEILNIEHDFCHQFYDRVTPGQDATLRAMNTRIGLDAWGLDCSFMDNGDIIVYEANAGMRFLAFNKPPDHPGYYLNPMRTRIWNAMRKLIVEA
jgi:hypothetical protein